MIEFILWTIGMSVAWALLVRFLRRKPGPTVTAEQIAEMALRKTADDLDMDVEQLRQMIKQAYREVDGRPMLRVVK